MSNKVRVGVVGTSWWADAMYLPALSNHPLADVRGVVGGTRPEHTREFAAQLGRPGRVRRARRDARGRAAGRPPGPHPQCEPLRVHDGRASARSPRPVREAAGDDLDRSPADGRGGGTGRRHHDGPVHLPVHAGQPVSQGARGRGLHRAAASPEPALLHRLRAVGGLRVAVRRRRGRLGRVRRPRGALGVPGALVLRRGHGRHRRVHPCRAAGAASRRPPLRGRATTPR